jgi:hypothetical protein
LVRREAREGRVSGDVSEGGWMDRNDEKKRNDVIRTFSRGEGGYDMKDVQNKIIFDALTRSFNFHFSFDLNWNKERVRGGREEIGSR